MRCPDRRRRKETGLCPRSSKHKVTLPFEACESDCNIFFTKAQKHQAKTYLNLNNIDETLAFKCAYNSGIS